MTEPAPPPDALVTEVARAMCARSRPNADPDRPTPAQRGALGFVPVWQLFVPLAEAALTVAREHFAALARSHGAAIRARVHITDDDATAARFEQRALVAHEVAELIEGEST